MCATKSKIRRRSRRRDERCLPEILKRCSSWSELKYIHGVCALLFMQHIEQKRGNRTEVGGREGRERSRIEIEEGDSMR